MFCFNSLWLSHIVSQLLDLLLIPKHFLFFSLSFFSLFFFLSSTFISNNLIFLAITRFNSPLSPLRSRVSFWFLHVSFSSIFPSSRVARLRTLLRREVYSYFCMASPYTKDLAWLTEWQPWLNSFNNDKWLARSEVESKFLTNQLLIMSTTFFPV